MGLGNEDKILRGCFFNFLIFFEREKIYDKTMEDEEEGEGRVWNREKEREGRRDVVVIGK